MTNEELRQQIDEVPALSDAKDKLIAELVFCGDNDVTFDPLLVLTVISIIVQVIIHCRSTQTDAEIKNTIRSIRTLPPRKLLRLRRALNNAWRDYCKDKDYAYSASDNPTTNALYELAAYVEDDVLDNLIDIARKSA